MNNQDVVAMLAMKELFVNIQKYTSARCWMEFESMIPAHVEEKWEDDEDSSAVNKFIWDSVIPEIYNTKLWAEYDNIFDQQNIDYYQYVDDKNKIQENIFYAIVPLWQHISKLIKIGGYEEQLIIILIGYVTKFKSIW